MLKKIIILFLLVFFGSIYSIIHAQFTLQYSAETNIITGNGEFTPFYLMNNRGGVISFTPNNGYLRAGVSKKIDNDKRFSYGFGIDLIGSYNNDATIYLQQLYGEIKYRCLGLMIGSKEQYSLMRDRELSSGSMVWSGNSRPIPQVSVGIPHFVNFPGTNGWMQIKGEISYGIFVDDAYQKEHKGEGKPYSKHVLYHRKYLILKFEKEKPFYGSIGIDMAAQFGGTIYDNPNFKTSVTKFPSGIKSFFKVFVPLSGGNDSPLIDQVNVTGNHLGSYLLEIGYRKKNWHAKLYHERYFDDHSGMIFKNKWDGLWGIEYRTIKKKLITGAVFEIMNSKDQSGPFLFDKTEELPLKTSGADFYYGHMAYNGWTHRGHTMGTPFIASPGYNTDGFLGFKSSRSLAFHAGIDGYIFSELSYKILAGHQQGWGTGYLPFTHITHEFSALAEINYRPEKIKGWTFRLSGAFDKGSLFGDNWGIQIGIRKEGLLFSTKK